MVFDDMPWLKPIMDAQLNMGDWRPVPGLDGFSVDSAGEMLRSGTGRRKFRFPRERTVGTRRELYVAISSKQYTWHRLVCAAWHGQPETGQIVLFRDGNPLNCRADNLYWGRRTDEKTVCPPSAPAPLSRSSYKLSSLDRLFVQHEAAPDGTVLSAVPGYPGLLASPDGTIYRETDRRAVVCYTKNIRGKPHFVIYLDYLTIPVHRLIALALLSPPERPGDVVYFRDGNSLNCAAANLYWGRRGK
ncbi:putative HNH endonuclease [Virus Rctr85]|nr:putative HNH endonuclease [Virus Rctr85]